MAGQRVMFTEWVQYINAVQYSVTYCIHKMTLNTDGAYVNIPNSVTHTSIWN